MKKDIIQGTTTIESIEPLVKYGEKYKLAFRCKSSSDTPRLCISWGYGNPPKISVGDKVNLEGKIKNNVFLVYSMKFKPGTN